MSEIDLSEKLRQLEAEVDDEIRVQNETRQKIWKEQSLPFMLRRIFIPLISRKMTMETVFWNMQPEHL